MEPTIKIMCEGRGCHSADAPFKVGETTWYVDVGERTIEMFKIGSITVSIEDGKPKFEYHNVLNQWAVRGGDLLFSNIEDAGKYLTTFRHAYNEDTKDED